MKMEVRSGSTTYFWFDNWMGTGRLIDVTAAVGTIYLGLPRRALVSEAVNSDGWCVRGKRSRRFQTLYNQILAGQFQMEILGMILCCERRERMIIRTYSFHQALGRSFDPVRIRFTG